MMPRFTTSRWWQIHGIAVKDILEAWIKLCTHRGWAWSYFNGMTQRFEYNQLQNPSKNIRVLRILPGDNEDIVQCELVETDLRDNGHTCLFYRWEMRQRSTKFWSTLASSRSEIWIYFFAMHVAWAIQNLSGLMQYLSTNSMTTRKANKSNCWARYTVSLPKQWSGLACLSVSWIGSRMYVRKLWLPSVESPNSKGPKIRVWESSIPGYGYYFSPRKARPVHRTAVERHWASEMKGSRSSSRQLCVSHRCETLSTCSCPWSVLE